MFLSFVSGFYLYGSLCSPCFLIGSYFDIKNLWLIIPVLLAVIGKHLTEEYYLYWIPSIYSGVSIAIAEINTLLLCQNHIMTMICICILALLPLFYGLFQVHFIITQSINMKNNSIIIYDFKMTNLRSLTAKGRRNEQSPYPRQSRRVLQQGLLISVVNLLQITIYRKKRNNN